MENIKWNRDDILSYINEFNNLYKKRPMKDNNGGMTSSHLLPVWYIIKKLKPKYIIESGVWQGQGTWFFEKACSYSKIIAIEPDQSNLKYKSDKVTYQTDDFLESNWSFLPKNDTLLFFDDHMDSLERLKHAHKLGFKKLIFEDNYPNKNAGCYSPKIILSNKEYYTTNQNNPIQENYDYLNDIIDVYQEMPPIFKGNETRWGTDWNNIDYPTVGPLLTNDDISKYPIFWEEHKGYTWLCYIELK